MPMEIVIMVLALGLGGMFTDEDRELTRKFDQLREDAKRGVA